MIISLVFDNSLNIFIVEIYESILCKSSKNELEITTNTFFIFEKITSVIY